MKNKIIEIFKQEQRHIGYMHPHYNWVISENEFEIIAEKIVKLFAIPDVSNSLDLRELERKLDELLGEETRKTLAEWLKQQRL